MGYMITPCLGLKLEANLVKTFMLDKMEPERIFLLTVRLLDFVFICAYLIALSLCYWLGWGYVLSSTHAHDPGISSLTCAPSLEPGTT